ncbi:hypothetical protein KCP70_16985 [Salmonella enterica subsp. enterica]|nr:hypothetical protein KCP70_16985 [Salmonella enterica subsp. enterica]
MMPLFGAGECSFRSRSRPPRPPPSARSSRTTRVNEPSTRRALATPRFNRAHYRSSPSRVLRFNLAMVAGPTDLLYNATGGRWLREPRS